MQYLDELVIHLKEEILLEILFVPLGHQAINCYTSGILCSAKRLTFKEVLSGDIYAQILKQSLRLGLAGPLPEQPSGCYSAV